MRQVSFHCPFTPHGKARPRFGNGRTYTDKKTVQFERDVASVAKSEMVGMWPLCCPVSLTIYAHFAMPKSWPKWKREKLNGRPHTQRPDADNIAKAVADALNGIVYEDDAQVAVMTVEKRWLDRAGFRVTVEEIG